MGQLIEDLLELARISRHNLVTDEVAPVALVREAIETLDPRLGGRAIEWVIDDLPPCRADRRLLKQVFINLIDNALKFTRSREPARIEIGWREGQAGTYFVRDNGVGFDPAEAEKLFQPFHRLHAAEEPHGTGIGLVIVERIVTRHGGRVWAEGKVGGGAMFAFTLAGGGHGPGSGRNAASPRPQLHAGSSGPASSRA
jgi:signal transduction histidine kinase